MADSHPFSRGLPEATTTPSLLPDDGPGTLKHKLILIPPKRQPTPCQDDHEDQGGAVRDQVMLMRPKRLPTPCQDGRGDDDDGGAVSRRNMTLVPPKRLPTPCEDDSINGWNMMPQYPTNSAHNHMIIPSRGTTPFIPEGDEELEDGANEGYFGDQEAWTGMPEQPWADMTFPHHSALMMVQQPERRPTLTDHLGALGLMATNVHGQAPPSWNPHCAQGMMMPMMPQRLPTPFIIEGDEGAEETTDETEGQEDWRGKMLPHHSALMNLPPERRGTPFLGEGEEELGQGEQDLTRRSLHSSFPDLRNERMTPPQRYATPFHGETDDDCSFGDEEGWNDAFNSSTEQLVPPSMEPSLLRTAEEPLQEPQVRCQVPTAEGSGHGRRRKGSSRSPTRIRAINDMPVDGPPKRTMRRQHRSAGDINMMLRGRDVSSNANFSWSKQDIKVAGECRSGTPDVPAGIPGSIQFVPGGASCNGRLSGFMGQDDLGRGPRDDNSRISREDSSRLSLDNLECTPHAVHVQASHHVPTEIIQRTLDEAIASLGGVASRKSFSSFPKASCPPASRPRRRSFVKKDDRFRLDDSKRTTSTMSSTMTSTMSELSNIQISIVQPPKPWICICGAENDDDFNFCGMCASKKLWTCSSCQFDRNKCRFPHCGGCGTRRSQDA
ncbi:expressed unknown protein [Seminavis robusta]|uniref:Uncharacterized protein n=1 Tax=Seminavis robusta TaxID=568900 RepID=A0A9N8EJP3_9STRA|nr:expressed unknown protein [Seminavis robusta]|eukprot:Sro1291_g259920.1 n/a (664) ;mRNA; f:19527-21608